jgi:hypothetical protein
MTSLIKVKDQPNFFRDPNSKAILVLDQTTRQNYINQRTLAQNAVNGNEELKQEVDNLKNEISDIKSMLNQILNKFESYK